MEKVSIHLQNPQTKTLETIIAVLNEGGVVLLPGDTSYF